MMRCLGGSGHCDEVSKGPCFRGAGAAEWGCREVSWCLGRKSRLQLFQKALEPGYLQCPRWPLSLWVPAGQGPGEGTGHRAWLLQLLAPPEGSRVGAAEHGQGQVCLMAHPEPAGKAWAAPALTFPGGKDYCRNPSRRRGDITPSAPGHLSPQDGSATIRA